MTDRRNTRATSRCIPSPVNTNAYRPVVSGTDPHPEAGAAAKVAAPGQLKTRSAGAQPEGKVMKSNKTPPILCGTDFSPNAAQAATVAAVLAARTSRPLLLVHVADEFNAYGESKQTLASFLKSVHERLRAEAERVQQTGVKGGVELLHGRVAEKAIADLAKKRSPALVVVSANGKSAFDRWTLGSVSEALAESAEAATVVVREAAGFEAWGRGERPLKVFVAVDSTNGCEAQLQWVRELLRAGPCEITVACAHRNPLIEERKRPGVDWITRAETARTGRQALERALRERIPAQLGAEPARILVETVVGHPDSRLIALAVEAGADVIVVGIRQRFGLDRLGHRSVSRAVLRRAPMNVVCVPSSMAAPDGVRIPRIHRVLVATDFSALGDRAVLNAYSLAREGGTVLLVHVTRPMRWPSVLGSNVEAKTSAARKAHAATLADAAARLRALIPGEGESCGIASEVHVIESINPARAINQTAERLGADAICLGTHGRSGLSAALVGSVTHAVMQQASRPVFLVRPPAG